MLPWVSSIYRIIVSELEGTPKGHLVPHPAVSPIAPSVLRAPQQAVPQGSIISLSPHPGQSSAGSGRRRLMLRWCGDLAVPAAIPWEQAQIILMCSQAITQPGTSSFLSLSFFFFSFNFF